MEKDLRLALLNKEKAELFLSNLENLRNDNAVNDISYSALKNEYNAALQQSVIKIEHIKAEYNKRLGGKNRELGIFKQELANLEARFKVGQISAAAYLKSAKSPERKVALLESQINHLNSLINARHSAEITIPQTTGLGSIFGSKSRSELQTAASAQINKNLEVPYPPLPQSPTQPIDDQGAIAIQDTTNISSLMILPDRAYPGSTIGIIANIINTGQGPIQHRTEFKVNDKVESYNDINLNPGQSEEITFMTVAGSPGDYHISVDNAQGVLKVLPPQ